MLPVHADLITRGEPRREARQEQAPGWLGRLCVQGLHA